MRRIRSLAGLTAAVAAAAGSAALLPGSAAAQAAAAPPVIALDALQPTALPAAPATAETSFDFVTTARTVHADDVTVTVDARGLAKIAKVTFSDNCTAHGLVATCWEMFDSSGSTTQHLGALTRLTLTALKGARLGAAGTYKVTGHSAHAKIVGGTGTVVVGGPSFNLKHLTDHKNLKVGSTVSEPVQFTNVGNRPARGVQVVLAASPGLNFATRYSNCKYGKIGNAAYALCYPKGAINLQETAALAAPVRLHVNSQALYTYLDVRTAPLGDPGWLNGQGIKWTWGKGPRLGLKVINAGHRSSVPAGSVSLPQNDGKVSDYTIASLQARNTADFAVSGAAAKATAGRTAKFTFRFTSHGPATLYDRSGGEGIPTVWATLPPGTTVVGHSADCGPWQEHNPQATAHGPYACWLPGLDIAKGQTSTFTLTVRVDKVIPHAKGSVKLLWGPDASSTYRPPYDPNKRDDSAVLALN